jgi:hypothetical protein
MKAKTPPLTALSVSFILQVLELQMAIKMMRNEHQPHFLLTHLLNRKSMDKQR